MSEAINYKISTDELTRHLLKIECSITRPNPLGQVISMPAWVPGSYLIRDFARHIIDICASSDGKELPITKIKKNSWLVEPCLGKLVITYTIYCFDAAPRGAYVDNERVFFDGARIFIMVEGEEEQNCSVEIERPKAKGTKNWRLATSMTPVNTDNTGFGSFVSSNHLELIDHPFEMGNFKEYDFEVAGIPHRLVISGPVVGDIERFVQDLAAICQGHIDIFGELPKMTQYLFILHAYATGYGGIEHRASCTLSCSRSDFPIVGVSEVSEGYRGLLGLCSHEYFHLWNVKRIKPEVFVNPDLSAEVYTKQLWIFEGITSYFDNLNLIRKKLIPINDYLEIVQKDITSLSQSPGAMVQNLEDASFDSWIKFYQPNENSANSMVSYYLKGSLVAMALDLMIITKSEGKQSLTDVMQVLWQQYGKTGLGLPEHYFERITYEVTGEDYSDFFDQALRSTKVLPLPELLLGVGVVMRKTDAKYLDSLGLKIIENQNKTFVSTVYNDTVAERAGVASKDVLVAINNAGVSVGNIEDVLQRFNGAPKLSMHLLRDDVLTQLDIQQPPIAQSVCELKDCEEISSEQQLLRDKWLGVGVDG